MGRKQSIERLVVICLSLRSSSITYNLFFHEFLCPLSQRTWLVNTSLSINERKFIAGRVHRKGIKAWYISQIPCSTHPWEWMNNEPGNECCPKGGHVRCSGRTANWFWRQTSTWSLKNRDSFPGNKFWYFFQLSSKYKTRMHTCFPLYLNRLYVFSVTTKS